MMDPNSTEVMNNIGLCYFNLQDYDKAIEYFTKAIRENYEFPRALNNLGNALRKKNQIPESINCYLQAIKVHSFLMK